MVVCFIGLFMEKKFMEICSGVVQKVNVKTYCRCIAVYRIRALNEENEYL